MLAITKKLHYEMSTHKVIHIAKSLKIQPHEPILVKEYAFANATNKTENKARKHNKVYKSLGNKWLKWNL